MCFQKTPSKRAWSPFIPHAAQLCIGLGRENTDAVESRLTAPTLRFPSFRLPLSIPSSSLEPFPYSSHSRSCQLFSSGPLLLPFLVLAARACTFFLLLVSVRLAKKLLAWSPSPCSCVGRLPHLLQVYLCPPCRGLPDSPPWALFAPSNSTSDCGWQAGADFQKRPRISFSHAKITSKPPARISSADFFSR